MASPTARANDIAVETMKQLATLAAAILALTVTFVKDLSGGAPSQANFPYLLFCSWFFLVVTIWLSWNTMAEAGIELSKYEEAGEKYAFRKDSSPRKLASITQACFFLGLAALVIFALVNWNSTPRISTTPGQQPGIVISITDSSFGKVSEPSPMD